MVFNVAHVSKPLASAVRVAEAKNIVVLRPDEGKSYMMNSTTRERIMLRKEMGHIRV